MTALALACIAAATLCPPHLYAQVPAAVGMRVERDVRYGARRQQRLDLFLPVAAADPASAATPVRLRAVVVFAAPESAERASAASAHRPYDNVARWAVRHGLIGVTMRRRDDGAWPDGPEDFAAVIAWMQAHVRAAGGDPQRLIFIAAGQAGTQLLSYLAHHEYWCCRGPGVAAAALLGAPLNLTPLVSSGGAATGAQARADRALLAPAHSDLAGLDNVYAPVFIGIPQHEDAVAQRSATILQQQLCRRGRCPTVRHFADHGLLSALLSLDTADESVSGPLLAWMTEQHR